jgi:hypothetical protein
MGVVEKVEILFYPLYILSINIDRGFSYSPSKEFSFSLTFIHTFNSLVCEYNKEEAHFS